MAGGTGAVFAEDVKDTESNGAGSAVSELPADTVDENTDESVITGDGPDAAVEESSNAEAAEDGDQLSANAKTAEAPGLEDVLISEDARGTVTISWTAFEGAKLYKVSTLTPKKPARSWKGDRTECSFADLKRDTEYSFSIAAYSDSKGKELIAKDTAGIKTKKIIFDESAFRTIKSKKVSAKRFNINLKKMIGEGNAGYAVAQGACTDGKYAYFMMASSATQKGRILKIRISDNKVIKKGPVINTHHGNGMTYDSKRKMLVAVGYGDWRQQLSFIDPKTLKITDQKNVSYPYKKMEGVKKGFNKNGLAAIAYVKKYDVYLARERGNVVSGGVNDIMIFNAENLKLIGYVRTKITADYPQLYQSMDADDKYVYFLLSAGSGQPYNLILCLDWNSENLLPVVNGENKYIEEMWSCNNDGSGKPDAAVRIKTSHEVEGLYHTTDKKTGKEHFYVSEYVGSWSYKTVVKKKAYKVKVKGKYKKKYKKVKVRVPDEWCRNDYLYDLGVI